MIIDRFINLTVSKNVDENKNTNRNGSICYESIERSRETGKKKK